MEILSKNVCIPTGTKSDFEDQRSWGCPIGSGFCGLVVAVAGPLWPRLPSVQVLVIVIEAGCHRHRGAGGRGGGCGGGRGV
jgi:hypothetical protein